MAVASLVCGLAGPCTGGLSALVGLVLGMVGAGRIDRSAGALRGKGLAVGGVIASVIGMILGILVLGAAAGLFFLAYRVENLIVNPHPATWNEEAVANLQTLSKAAFGYASLNDGCLPPADTWPTDLAPYLRDDTGQVMAWPASRGIVYAMNRSVGGMKLNDIPQPDRTVLFFFAKGGSPPAGGQDEIVWRGEPAESNSIIIKGVICFVDGHTEEFAFRQSELDKFIWDPNEAPSKP